MCRHFSTEVLNPTVYHHIRRSLKRIEADICTHGSLKCYFCFMWVCARVCAGTFSVASTKVRFLNPKRGRMPIYALFLQMCFMNMCRMVCAKFLGYASGGMRQASSDHSIQDAKKMRKKKYVPGYVPCVHIYI